jgi:hypothetical protein
MVLGLNRTLAVQLKPGGNVAGQSLVTEYWPEA